MKKVFVTMISFNNNKATFECLDSLEKIKKDGFKMIVVVVDNASVDKFVANKKYKNFDLEILRSEENLGFTGGQNLGIKHALKEGADYIVILNNDVIVDEGLIGQLLTAFKQDVGIVAPKIYFAKGYEFHKDRYKDNEKGRVIWYAGGVIDWKNVLGKHRGVDEVDLGQFEEVYEPDTATGCCMMVRKEVFEKTGFLDDKYFLYYEDADFSLRVKRNGFKIVYQPKAMLWHKNAASAGGSGSPLQDYYITRNRLVFGYKYASLRIKIALFREGLRLMFLGRKWQKKGVFDYFTKNLGKGSYFS
ncbi:MAG: glycosyltransferase family 2 protein [Patescibacteria group bacterium]